MITWLASYPKSGNTWIRLLLNAYLNENNDLNKIYVAENDNKPYHYYALSPKKDLTHDESLLLRTAALFHLAHNKAQVLKTHNANCRLTGIGLIPELLTKNAVYIVRDPRDTVLSLARHFGQTIDEAIDALNDKSRSIDTPPTFHYMGDWSFHVNSWMDSTFPVHVVKYEDLISDPRGTFSKLLPFLDIQPDGDRIEMALNLTEFETLQAKERETGFNEKSSYQDVFFKHKGSRWREVLTNEQRNKIESAHSETMLKLGYD